MTARDWYEFVETDLENGDREKFRRLLSDIGFDDLYVERTENHGICDSCSRECRLYLVWNRGQLRESEPVLVCSTCANRIKEAVENRRDGL
jgi:hypothetical protein